MQNQEPLDSDFLAFRDRGDVDALVRYFDAAAPRLALLAAHVVRSAADAEDLVQATFLEAIQSRADCRGDRPVLAWLAGILRHRALDLARRRTTRNERALVELEEHEEPGDERLRSPLDLAADAESFERISAAIVDLEQPYREVLSLRLVHGLEPTAIGAALDRSPSTVRVQLKRGLERLRAALPDPSALLGLGVAATIIGEGARGLAAVRASVLAGLPASPTVLAPKTGAAPTASVGVAWSTIAVLGVLAVAVIASIPLLWQSTPGVVAEPARTALAQANLAPVAEPFETELVALGDTTAREALPASQDQSATSSSPTTTVRGRLLLPDGSPARGAEATLQGWINTRGRSESTSDVVAVANDNGDFEVAFEPRTDFQYALAVKMKGQVEANWRWSPEEVVAADPGSLIDLGTSQLPPARPLTVRLVDREGALIAIEWDVQTESLWRPEGLGASTFYELRTTQSGAVTFDAVAIGGCRLYATSSLGHVLSQNLVITEDGPGTVELEYRGPDARRRVAVELSTPDPTLALVQRPSADHLTLTDATGRHYTASKSEGRASTYVFDDVADGTYTLHFDDPSYEMAGAEGVRPGTSVRLRSSLNACVDMTVRGVDAHDLLDAVRIDVAVQNDVHGSPVWSGPIEVRATESVQVGTRRVRTVLNAQRWVITAPGYAPHEVAFDDGFEPGARTRIDVVLVPAATLSGQVVRADGSPVAGVVVHARRARPLPDGLDVWEVKRDYMNAVGALAKIEATTDTLGRFVIAGVADVEYDLVVSLARGVRASAYDVLPSAGACTLTLPPAGSVRGRLTSSVPIDFTRCVVEIEGIEEQEDVRLHEFAPRRLRPEPVAKDGTFALAWIPASTHTLTIRLPGVVVPSGGSGHQTILGPVFESVPISIDDGEVERIERDVSSRAPTHAHVTVAIAGERTNDLVVLAFGSLAGAAADADVSTAVGIVDADGVAQVAPLYPGTWNFVVTSRTATWSVELARAVVVEPGVVPQLEGAVALARGRIEFESSEGTPLALASFDLRTLGSNGAWSGSVGRNLDGDGGTVLVLPAGVYTARVSAQGAGVPGAPTTAVEFEWTKDGPKVPRVRVP